MRIVIASVASLIVAGGLASVATHTQVRQGASNQAVSRIVAEEDVTRWKKELSNWGRWGPDDQIGTMNLVTPEKRLQATTLVKEGVVVSLARDVLTEKAPDNAHPFEHDFVSVGNDRFSIQYHGFAHTHLDSLAHVADEHGSFYNGYKPETFSVTTSRAGHLKNSIHNLKNGIVTRGVLMDIPRLKGVDYLEPGTPIYVEDLEAWERQAGVRVGPGDAVFVRTGRWARRDKLGPWNTATHTAGLDPSTIPWLRERDVALIGSDSWQEVVPRESAGRIHGMMTFIGYHLFDNCDLEAVAVAAAARNRWEFMLMVAPLAVRGATGSPVNPIAMF